MNFLKPETAARNLSSERNYLARIGLSDDQIDSELQDSESSQTLVIEEKEGLGRRGGAIPDEVKEQCAILSAQDVPQKDIAAMFGIAQSSVSNFANGMDNNRIPDPKLENTIETEREKIEKEALAKTMMTLGLIEAEDLMMLGAKDKSIVAQNLSKVAANMKDKNVTNDNRVQMIIHAPQVRADYHYQEIEVNS